MGKGGVLMLDNRSRLILEANFIFSLWKNPKYYHMFLKKMVTDPSVFFKNKSSLFYFSIGEQMATKGYQVFDVATVVAYVSGYPELQEEFETYGGYATVAKIMDKVSEENRETYFIEIMKAMSGLSVNSRFSSMNLFWRRNLFRAPIFPLFFTLKIAP